MRLLILDNHRYIGFLIYGVLNVPVQNMSFYSDYNADNQIWVIYNHYIPTEVYCFSALVSFYTIRFVSYISLSLAFENHTGYHCKNVFISL